MHHRRAVPMKRPGPRIDQLARHTAPVKLRSQQQPRRPRTDHDRQRALAPAIGCARLHHSLVLTAPIRISLVPHRERNQKPAEP
jgi:hypothetical protein